MQKKKKNEWYTRISKVKKSHKYIHQSLEATMQVPSRYLQIPSKQQTIKLLQQRKIFQIYSLIKKEKNQSRANDQLYLILQSQPKSCNQSKSCCVIWICVRRITNVRNHICIQHWRTRIMMNKLEDTQNINRRHHCW